MEVLFRRASADDAAVLAELIHIAGESPRANIYDVFFGGDRDSELERLRRLVLAAADLGRSPKRETRHFALHGHPGSEHRALQR